MRLTRRGWGVLGATIAAVVSGGLFGARSLDAIAVPGVVVLVAAWMQLQRLEPPGVERELPAVAHRDDAVAVRLRVDADSSFRALVLDHLDFGLVSDDGARATTLPSGPIEYDIECLERGRRRVGPTRIEARDVFGLLSRAFVVDNAVTLLVRPRIYPIAGLRRPAHLPADGGERRDRHEFEHLREYDHGDALRDVHWKTSAKQPDGDLIVKEFTGTDQRQTVVVAAEASREHADEMADAAASVVLDLLDEGFRVGLVTAQATLEPGSDARQRDVLLDHLAVVDGGQLSENQRSRADVVVRADGRGVVVTVGTRSIPFEALAGTASEGGETERSDEQEPPPRERRLTS